MHKVLMSLRTSVMLVRSNARDVAALMIPVPLTAVILAPTPASLHQQSNRQTDRDTTCEPLDSFGLAAPGCMSPGRS